MSLLYPPEGWADINIDARCKVWTVDDSGTQRRKINAAAPFGTLVDNTNHFYGYAPRVLIAQTQTNSTVETAGSAPLYNYRYFDGVDNARTAIVRALVLPNSSNSSSCTMTVTGSTSFTYGQVDNAAPSFPQDLTYVEFETSRGNVTDNYRNICVDTANDFTLIDLIVQEKKVPIIDTSIHSYAGRYAVEGTQITNVELQDLRDSFHEIRKTNLTTCITWAATGVGDGYLDSSTTPALSVPGDQRGFYVDSETVVNLLDQTVTSRSATSPGVSCPAQYMGVGAEDETAGQSIDVEFHVLANALDANAVFEAHGPDHVADNFLNVLVEQDTLKWYTGNCNIKLCTIAGSDTWTNTTRNKIDLMGKVDSGGKLFVYGIYAQVRY